MDEASWTTRLLERSPCLARDALGQRLARIAAASLAAVDPAACVARHTHRLAKPTGEAAVLGEFVFDLAADPAQPGPGEHGRVWIVGAGKASAAMAAALVDRFGERIAGGLVIVKHGELGPIPGSAVERVRGDHPIPGPATWAATAKLTALADAVGPRDLVLSVISGGASALLSRPLVEPALWIELGAELLGRDVSIQAINKLRRRFDALKAGGLARLFAPATVVSLIISDVVGDELALVGSGPTVYADQAELDAYPELLAELGERVVNLPPRLRAMLAAPPVPEPWPRDADGQPQGVHHVLLARNGDAREAACRRAQAEGLDSIVLLPALGGPAADEGRRLAALLRAPPPDLPIERPACLITGGETTVDLEGAPASARGGRNQELALAALPLLAGLDHAALLTLASDGEDGPTDAAGALVRGDSLARARAAGLDPEAALARHDSHTLLDALGDLVRTGPTGTNVCDLAVLLLA